MNLGEGPFHQDKRVWWIAGIGLASAIVALITGYTQLALGITTGTAVGIFNYWLMTDALKKGKEMENKQANRLFLMRYLLRMVISVAALVAAMQVGVQFVLGALAGLFLHLATYFGDVIKIMRYTKQ
ncbi:MAG: ATP synthase subunit I [Bacillota bacterium]